PPEPDDQADLLLCDILDAIDRNPALKNHGSAYGADRHLANLQVFGLWRKREPISRPTALELFTTTFSTLIAGATTSSTGSTMNNSPAPQEFSQNGELIGPSTTAQAPCSEPGQLSQHMDGVLVVSTPPSSSETPESPDSRRIIRHGFRHGRPLVLDDLAKG